MKGTEEYIVLILVSFFTLLMIVILAPLVSDAIFESDLNAIKESSVNEYKANAVAAAMIQNETIVDRANNFTEWEQMIEEKRNRKDEIQEKLDGYREDSINAENRISGLIDVARKFRENDIDPEAEYEGRCDIITLDKEENLICERDKLVGLLEENTGADSEFFEETIIELVILREEIKRLEKKKERLKSDIENLLSRSAESYFFGYYIGEPGNLEKQWEVREEGGRMNFTRFAVPHPDEKRHVYRIGVAR